MMKKRAIILSLCLLFTLSVFNITASAKAVDDSSVQPLTVFIADGKASATRKNGVVSYTATLYCEPTATTCGITVYVQCRKAGTSLSWINCGTKSGSGTTSCIVTGTKTAESEYEYRIKAKFTAGNSSNSETGTAYSGAV